MDEDDDPTLPIPLIYGDDFPGVEEVEFASRGHHFIVTAVKQPAVHTWRQRYRIECRTCNVVLHDATTGPRAHARQHLQSAG